MYIKMVKSLFGGNVKNNCTAACRNHNVKRSFKLENKHVVFIYTVVLLELLALALASQQPVNNNVEQLPYKYYGNAKGTKVVEMYQNECHEFVDSDALWIYKTRQNQITALNPIQFELLMEKCGLHKDETPDIGSQDRNSNGTNDGLNFISMENYNGTISLNETDTGNSTEATATPIVYPGTKWCGRGDIARSYDDIGLYAHTDNCCRDHDNCPDNIPAGEVRHGLRNEAAFTSSHCDCDDAFLQCLKSDHTLSRLTSSKIAHIYFNILKPLCFDERHPVISCQQTRLTGECIRPEYNYREGRQWQFFAAQPYFAKTVRGLLDTFNNVFGTTEAPLADPTSQSGRRINAMPPGFTF